MSREVRADVCVLGAGSAGLAAAYLATRFGARTVLVERADMGGECLNTGCVPSKTLLAVAKRARVASAPVDFGRVHERVHEVIRELAPHDSAERYERLGAEVIRAEARFTGARMLAAGHTRIRARRVIVATGSAPRVPPIEGLQGVEYFTNETIFENRSLPRHLVIVGGGPLGIELAQAHRRLGARVTVLEQGAAMDKDEPELARALLKRLAAEGISVREKAKVRRVEPSGGGVALIVEEAGQESRVEASHLLVATGRAPRVAGLGLERARIKHDERGIAVDAHLRTSARGVYAIGDVVKGAPRFTHIGAYHAGVAIRNALFYLPAKVDYRALPWVTYTDPELAHTGMSEKKAREAYGEDVRIDCSPLRDNDRAHAEGETAGMVKLVARANGRVLGASILAPHAGELIQPWILAIERGLKLKDLARMIVPYPTLGEASKRAAAAFYDARLFNGWTRGLARALAWLP